VICGRNEARLREAAGRIGAVAVPADVSREADVLRLVVAVVNQLGGYNVLINNAAFGHFSPLVELSTEKFNALLATNLTGAMVVARESAKHFVANSTATSSTSLPQRAFQARRAARPAAPPSLPSKA
jgi:3-oxoacyl-[acyl-carrier protein] reductase